MLVLIRREGERIRIGPDCYLTVVRVEGDKVRLGFDAPASVEIVRYPARGTRTRRGIMIEVVSQFVGAFIALPGLEQEGVTELLHDASHASDDDLSEIKAAIVEILENRPLGGES